MGAPKTYGAKIQRQLHGGPDLLVLRDGLRAMNIPLNPDVAAEIRATLEKYERDFERTSLVAQVNRRKRAADQAIKDRKAAQQALSAFDDRHGTA